MTEHKNILRLKDRSELSSDIQTKYTFLKNTIKHLENHFIALLNTKNQESVYKQLRQVRVVKNELKICLNNIKHISVWNKRNEITLNMFNEQLDDLIINIKKVKL